MIIDAHVHASGRERPDEVLRTLDEAGVDIAVLVAPCLGEGRAPDAPASPRRGNEHLARLVKGREDRLIGFAVVDPSGPGASGELRHAVETLGLRGCKMVPGGWYPHDEAVQPVFATARELGIPLLLHSGICVDGRSGRFCRPSFFEALRDHPGLRVTLAHLGWPWTDEAIAVGLIDPLNGVPPAQCLFRFDISFGAPPPCHREVLHKALEALGAGLLQFGSNCVLPCGGAQLADRIGRVRELLDELELPRERREQIWSGTAAAWLGLDRGRPRRPRHPIADCRCAARTLPDPFSPLSF